MLKLVGFAKQYLYGARLFGTFDFCFENGKIYAVVGQGKCGKTAFVKALTGVESHEGKVNDGENEFDLKSGKTVVLFDDGALFEMRSVRYNLEFGLRVRKVKKTERREKADAAAKICGIEGLTEKRVGTLNAIEKRKVAAARLFVRQTENVIVDDFCSVSKDEDEREKLWQWFVPLLQKKKEDGNVVIFTTSSAEETNLADEIIVLHAGEIKQVGKLDDIIRNPKSVWAAEAVDKDFCFERAVLELDGIELDEDENNAVENGNTGNRKAKLTLAYDDGRKEKTDICTDDIVSDEYIGKNVIAGKSVAYGGKTKLFDGANENCILK